ncbi:hypothetical protein [Acanthopleuribacter pedis]|uniref:Lipoprotein n=1 Tax=Acanthopleuribacter pedis TaxID=442870 RepID=A0A8J7Q6F4_9BACT|nr:hypothetical protein [Acanthopleuribacter pedis]MBO1318991.1 hypothetical protein [Acanthopleuribacter pedis]
MKPQLKILLIAALALLAVACGGNANLYETRLDGFDNGKRTMKLTYNLTKASSQEGASMRIDYLFQFSQGTKVRRSKKRTTLVNADYHMVHTNAVEIRGPGQTTWDSKIEDGFIVTTETKKGGETREVKIPVEGPVYSNVFPLMFYRDLRNKGDEIAYNIYFEVDEKVAPIKVRYIGETKAYVKSIAVPARHYQVQMGADSDDYQDYYLNPQNGKVIKMAFGKIEFLPTTD